MDVARAAFPLGWIAITSAIALAVLGIAILRAPWRRLAASQNLNVWCGAIVVLTVLWSVRAELGHGVVIHLLGMAGFALMVGPWLALCGGALVVVLCAWLHGVAPSAMPTEFLASVLVPVAVVLVVLRLTQRFLPPNLFIYTIVAAFFGAALGAFLAGLAGATSLVVAGAAATTIFDEYVPYLIFLAFGEAMLTGMALTLAVVYRPQWVATFDDDVYLARGP